MSSCSIFQSSDEHKPFGWNNGKPGFYGERLIPRLILHERYFAPALPDDHGCMLPGGIFLSATNTHDDSRLLEPVLRCLEHFPDMQIAHGACWAGFSGREEIQGYDEETAGWTAILH